MKGVAMLRTVIFDTITGEPLNPVEAAGGTTWAARLNGSGRGDLKVSFGSGLPRSLARELFQPNARIVAHIDDLDTVVAAGIILQVEYDRPASMLTVTWGDIRELFRQRMGFGVGSWNSTGTLQVTDRSYSGAVRAIVSRGMRDFTQPSWMLPIDLPPDGTGTFSRKWDYFAFPTMDDCLREVEKEGVEIYFDPYLTSGGNLRFTTRVGTPIVGIRSHLPVTAPDSRVESLVVTRDGSKQLTGVIYAGNGTDQDTRTAWAGGGPFIIPIRDAYRSAKRIKNTAQLQRVAAADLADHRLPLEQWSFTARVGGALRSSMLKPGRLLGMDVQGDPWLGDTSPTQRVIGASGSFSDMDKISMEVQQYGG